MFLVLKRPSLLGISENCLQKRGGKTGCCKSWTPDYGPRLALCSQDLNLASLHSETGSAMDFASFDIFYCYCTFRGYTVVTLLAYTSHTQSYVFEVLAQFRKLLLHVPGIKAPVLGISENCQLIFQQRRRDRVPGKTGCCKSWTLDCGPSLPFTFAYHLTTLSSVWLQSNYYILPNAWLMEKLQLVHLVQFPL